MAPPAASQQSPPSTDAFHKALARQNSTIARVLAANPGFDISQHPLSSLTSLDDASAVAVGHVQRIANVLPSRTDEHAAVIPKVVEKFTSAAHIASLSTPGALLSAVPSLTHDQAKAIHLNAQRIAARNELLAARQVSLKTPLTQSSFPLFQEPNLQDLFGDSNAISYECDEHCGSVLSPAAYLVDLLQSLPAAAEAELKLRRPDVFHLELSCANTDTEVPLVDLVSEVLESYIYRKVMKKQTASGSTGVIAYNSDKNTGAVDDAVEPQNVDLDAYSFLVGEVVPLGVLPYDRNLHQTRALLNNLSVSRDKILRHFQPIIIEDAKQSSLYNRTLSAESLSLLQADYIAITGQSFTEPLPGQGDAPYARAIGRKPTHEYWGFQSEGAMMSDYDGICRVFDHFLPKTGYSLSDLQDLLKTKFISPVDIPDIIDEAGLGAEELWSGVRWSKTEADGKWDGLVNNLASRVPDARFPAGSVLANRIRAAVSKLPDRIVLTSGPEKSSGMQSGQVDNSRVYSMQGWVQWAENPDKVTGSKAASMYLDGSGVVQGAGYTWYFDQNGTARYRTAISYDDATLYAAAPESQKGLSLFLRWPDATSPPSYKLAQDSRTWEPLSERAQNSWERGPAAASESAQGWAWPLPAASSEGQSSDELTRLTIRKWSGLPLTVDAWARINSFIRLQKATGWTIEELDDALTSVSADTITPLVVQNLGYVKALQDETGFSVSQVALLWAKTLDRGAYTRVFLKPAVVRADSIFAYGPDEEPQFTSDDNNLISKHLAGISVALSSPVARLQVILVALGLQEATLTHKNLAALLRYHFILKATNQPPDQLQHLSGLYAIEKIVDANTALNFIRFWKRALSNGAADPATWGFIVQGNNPSAGTLSQPLLETAWDIQQKLVQRTAKPGESLAVDDWLPSIASHSPSISLDAAKLILSSYKISIPEDKTTAPFVGYFCPATTGTYNLKRDEGKKPEDPNSTLFEKPVPLVGRKFYSINGSNLEWKTAGDKNDYTSVPKEALLSLSFVNTVKSLVDLLGRYEALSATLSIAKDDVENIVDIIDLKVGTGEEEATSPKDYTHALELLDIGSCIEWVGSAKTLRELLSHTQSTSEAIAKAIADATGSKVEVVQSLFESFSTSTKTSSVPTTNGAALYAVTIPVLVRIRETSKICQLLGVTDPSIIFGWANLEQMPDMASKTAVEVRNVCRAHAGDSWDSTAAALFDPIRRASRAALIAACINHIPGLVDSDELFEYFLIDVNIGTCFRTSRLKQALSSVQLFYQRCLLGLERIAGLNIADFDQTVWSWKKSYDTWQANRRVLLWPENWLDPTLRDVKTPEFQALETSMNQGQFDVEAVFSKYIASTALIADLEPIATYAGPTRDHLFARTREVPHMIYYRNVDITTRCWSPWVKVNVEIPTIQLVRKYHVDFGNDMNLMSIRESRTEDASIPKDPIPAAVQELMANIPDRPMQSGSLVYPFVLDGNDDRLLLFLPTVTEQKTTVKLQNNANVVKYTWEIGMSVSQLKDGKWTPKQSSATSVLAMADQNEGLEKTWTSSFGWTDVDENKRRLACIGCWPYQIQTDGSTCVGIKVYSACPLVNKPRKEIASLDEGVDKPVADIHALLVGEFLYEGGHLRVLRTRPTTQTEDSKPIRISGTSDNKDISFGGLNSYDDSSDLVNYSSRILKPAGGLYNGAGEKVYPQTEELLNWYTIRQTIFKRRKRSFNVGLGHYAAEDFQHLVAAGQYTKLFDYFGSSGNKTWTTRLPYNLEDRIDDSAWPTQLDQALGKEIKSEPTYHELRTPTAIYNWELCVHLPMLLADHFFQAQLFDRALDMIKLVMDLTASDKTKIWKFLPFREEAVRTAPPTADELDETLAEWSQKPFDPFAIARHRLTTYMKWFAHKFIEITTAKGDAEFRRFTMESINNATQCYVEASHVCGRRQQIIPRSSGPPQAKKKLKTYGTLTGDDDAWSEKSNVLVRLENLYPGGFNESSEPATTSSSSLAVSQKASVPPVGLFGPGALNYFCVPTNTALRQMKDTIDNRLFNIRNCRDIDGNPRKLALWEPPMDPGAFVRGAAAGGLGSLLDGPQAVAPNFRFTYLLRLAQELTSEVKNLGSLVLSLRERKDSEMIAGLRLKQESAINTLILDSRKMQMDEAKAVRDMLTENRRAAVSRMNYYLRLLGQDPRDIIPVPGGSFQEFSSGFGKSIMDGSFAMSQFEASERETATYARDISFAIPFLFDGAAIAAMVPQFIVAMTPGGVGEETENGGAQISNMMALVAQAEQATVDFLKQNAEDAARTAALQRQMEERTMAANQAGYEITGIDAQIAIQDGRIAQAQKDIDIQSLALEHQAQMETFYQSKYSSAELYTWMINSLQRLYYQSYNLAVTTAQQAQLAFSYERGAVETSTGDISTTSSYIQAGTYWNATRDGLLAGEQLSFDLRRLEAAYVIAKPHDHELIKHVSLRQFFPRALVNLRTTGSTGVFKLPEVLFDLDFPGHYRRRIKSVSVSIPCVVGPYTSVNCTLKLLDNRYRVSIADINDTSTTETAENYRDKTDDIPANKDAPETRFRSESPSLRSIAISTAQSDPGVFELNFRDERYIPFEGAGVISSWTLDLNAVTPQFSYSTISDVVLHIRYTSNESAKLVKPASLAAQAFLLGPKTADGLCLHVDAKAEFATAWAAFRASGVLVLTDLNKRLPFFARASDVVVTSVGIAAVFGDGAAGQTLVLDGAGTLDLAPQTSDSGSAKVLDDASETAGSVTGSDAVVFTLEKGKILPGQKINSVVSKMKKLKDGDTWVAGVNADNWTFSFQDGDKAAGSNGTKTNGALWAKDMRSLQLLICYKFYDENEESK